MICVKKFFLVLYLLKGGGSFQLEVVSTPVCGGGDDVGAGYC